jgi:hypothetical protein
MQLWHGDVKLRRAAISSTFKIDAILNEVVNAADIVNALRK